MAYIWGNGGLCMTAWFTRGFYSVRRYSQVF